MPNIDAAIEQLKFYQSKGRGNEKVHIVMVEEEQEERIKNNKRKTRFVLSCDDPDLCSAFEAHKDRVIRKVKNKAVALSLMERAWGEALSDGALDKILAEDEINA